MSPEVITIIVSSAVSIIGFLVTFIVTRYSMKHQLSLQEKQWQEGFRAELRKDLIMKSTLHVIENRLNTYEDVWRVLRKFSGFHLRRDKELHKTVEEVGSELNNLANSKAGMIMTERSRKLTSHLLSGCSFFLKGELGLQEIHNRSHLLKSSLRSDLGIENYEYENEMNNIASKLGRVDDWMQ